MSARSTEVEGDAQPRGRLPVQGLSQEEVHERDQRRPGEEERPSVEQGEPDRMVERYQRRGVVMGCGTRSREGSR
jgi:hypothetical protein